MTTKKYLDELTYKIIGCAIEVHKILGPGLLESVYERCLIHECRIANLDVKSQIKIPINYKGINLDAELRLDLLINDLIVVEVKAVETFHPVYEAQILSYMRLLEMPKGILLNFCSNNIFKDGQKTFVNMHFSNLPDE